MPIPDIVDRAENAIAIGLELCILTAAEIERFAGVDRVEWYPRDDTPWWTQPEPADPPADMPPARSARIVRLVNGQFALDMRPLIEERKP